MINLSPGPAPLPQSVMGAYSQALLRSDLISQSHRSLATQSFIKRLQSRVREALQLDDHYEVLFLAGSSRETTQRLFRDFEDHHHTIGHFVTGYWSEWASLQTQGDPESDAQFLHVCLNETVNGIFIEQCHDLPVIADVTSCLFTCQFKHCAAIWYASGQKIFSMPGFSLVIVDRNRIDESMALSAYVNTLSSCVTPPIHGMLLLECFLQWLEEKGGVVALEAQTKQRADQIYQMLDGQGMLLVEPHLRSATSLVFHGESEAKTSEMIAYMRAKKVIGFKNHPAAGGMRIMNLPGLDQKQFEALLQFIEAFV